jgi:hypothetical protein
MNRVEEATAITRNSASPTTGSLSHHKTRTPERDGVRTVSSTTSAAVAGNGLPVGGTQPALGGSSAARSYPYNLEVKLEAVDRIQTQVNLNRASMEGFSRELQRNVAEIHALKLHHNSFVDQAEHYTQVINELRAELVAMKQEMAALHANTAKGNATTAAVPGGGGMDDHTLEILSRNLASVSAKANEVEHLTLGQELLKRRVTRLEEQMTPPASQSKPEPASHQNPSHPLVPNQPPQASPPTMTHPSQHERRLSSVQYPHIPQHGPEAVPSRHPQQEAEMHSSGWASVNKRALANGVEVAPISGESSPSKRQRLLAPLEPRRSYDSTRYDPARHDTGGQPVSYQRNDSNESYPESTESPSYQHANVYQEKERDAAAPAHDIERQRAASSGYGPHSVQPQHTSPNSRGRGRGGRPRKYMPADRGAWQSEKAAIVNGNVVHRGADGQWYTVGPAESSRRSSIADPSMAMSPATQAAVLHQQQSGPYSPGMQTSPAPRDPYAHTKKTRTKPVRNADGVLIRKDGRPDMRSHSSAANLRKVHAKKEQERRLEAAAHGQPFYPHAETRGTSASSTPGPLTSSHRPSDAGHMDDHEGHYDHDGHEEHEVREMKREGVEDRSHYSREREEQYTPSVGEERVTTPESLREVDRPTLTSHQPVKEVDGDPGSEHEEQKVIEARALREDEVRDGKTKDH